MKGLTVIDVPLRPRVRMKNTFQHKNKGKKKKAPQAARWMFINSYATIRLFGGERNLVIIIFSCDCFIIEYDFQSKEVIFIYQNPKIGYI